MRPSRSCRWAAAVAETPAVVAVVGRGCSSHGAEWLCCHRSGTGRGGGAAAAAATAAWEKWAHTWEAARVFQNHGTQTTFELPALNIIHHYYAEQKI
mmetsp:Transcript_12911/g.22943  ORF Transcript_12911/g.22943 Transcript_12911/m.22943 type:complete len:97 (+) Transcript_12911:1697-1987(+)